MLWLVGYPMSSIF